MNNVNIPTKLKPDESKTLKFRIKQRALDYLRDAFLLAGYVEGEVLSNNYYVPADLCYDNRGRIIIRLTLDNPDVMLSDIAECAKSAMKLAEAESSEIHIQYPNVAYEGVDFVTIDKVVVEALCSKIDELCKKAGYSDGLSDLGMDPQFGDFSLAFAHLFDLRGGHIYNFGHSMTFPKDKEEFKISPEDLAMMDEVMKDLSERKEPEELDPNLISFDEES